MNAALVAHQFSAHDNPARKPRRLSKRLQILALQESLYSMVRGDKVEPQAAASCARAWDVLEDRLRVMKMKPKPRDQDVPVVGGRGFRGGKVLPAPVEDLRPGAAPACCAGPSEPDSIGAKA